MPLIKELSFPFQNSLNGVFRQFKTLLNGQNIIAANYVSFEGSNPSSGFEYFCGAIVDYTKYFVTKPTGSERYFIVNFQRFRFSITGYTIYNRGIGDFHKYWEILISNDKLHWTSVNTQIPSRRPTSETLSFVINKPVFPAKYIKMK